MLVDVRNPQALSSGIGLGKTAREEIACRFESVQLERLRGTLIAHPVELCGSAIQFDSNPLLIGHGFIHNG